MSAHSFFGYMIMKLNFLIYNMENYCILLRTWLRLKEDNKIFFNEIKPLQFCSILNTREVANKWHFQYYIKILFFKYTICQKFKEKHGKFCNTYDSHISGIMQYLFFSDWIISLSIMLKVHPFSTTSEFFCFVRLNIPLYVYNTSCLSFIG